MSKILLTINVNEHGGVNNKFDFKALIEESQRNNIGIDVYLAFMIKTAVDDFGEVIKRVVPENSFNKEQFEADFLMNLEELLTTQTRAPEEKSTEENESN